MGRAHALELGRTNRRASGPSRIIWRLLATLTDQANWLRYTCTSTGSDDRLRLKCDVNASLSPSARWFAYQEPTGFRAEHALRADLEGVTARK